MRTLQRPFAWVALANASHIAFCASACSKRTDHWQIADERANTPLVRPSPSDAPPLPPMRAGYSSATKYINAARDEFRSCIRSSSEFAKSDILFSLHVVRGRVLLHRMCGYDAAIDQACLKRLLEQRAEARWWHGHLVLVPRTIDGTPSMEAISDVSDANLQNCRSITLP